MSTEPNMSPNTNPAPNVLSPQERLDAGYKKSVAALASDIMKEYGQRLDNGTKLFRYLKSWHEDGYFMSPLYTQGDCMKPGVNTILQPESDIWRFWDDVRTKLVCDYGVHPQSWTVKYRNNNTGWHHMRFDIELSLDHPSSQP